MEPKAPRLSGLLGISNRSFSYAAVRGGLSHQLIVKLNSVLDPNALIIFLRPKLGALTSSECTIAGYSNLCTIFGRHLTTSVQFRLHISHAISPQRFTTHFSRINFIPNLLNITPSYKVIFTVNTFTTINYFKDLNVELLTIYLFPCPAPCWKRLLLFPLGC